MLRVMFGAALALSLLGSARPAMASQEYPEELSSQLDMDCPPPCTICHDSQAGGSGTARKPFALAMIDQGLTGNDTDTISPALGALDSAGTDSDADGVGDVAELRASTDPNVAGDASICGPAYGCGARIAAGSRIDPVALLSALLLGACLLLSVRRRSR